MTTLHQKGKGHHKAIYLRPWVQGFFFFFVLITSLNHFLEESGTSLTFWPKASLHAICPFGGVVSLYQFFAVGTLVQKIHQSAFVLMAAVFLLAVLAGPVLCGWICPLGTFQEWVSKLGKKMVGSRFGTYIPNTLDPWLRYFRYLVLIWVVYQTAVTGRLIFQGVDPYYALFNLWSEEVAPGALAILGATTLLALVTERPWCKYACPYGALLGFSNKIRIFKIRRSPSTCIDCGACDMACPMNIKVSQSETVMSSQCISCLRCTSEFHCPVPQTVSLIMKGGGGR